VCCLKDKYAKLQCVSIILANNIRHENVTLPNVLLKYQVTPEECIQNFASIEKSGNPRVKLHSSCTVQRVHLSSLKAKPSPSNVISGNVFQTSSLGMELDTSLPRAVKSAVKQFPEQLKFSPLIPLFLVKSMRISEYILYGLLMYPCVLHVLTTSYFWSNPLSDNSKILLCKRYHLLLYVHYYWTASVARS